MSAGLPYLGSKISLISQSDVRYEGILYTIDTVANTVALAKVRSFGTEDRPTDRPMPPREEEYEYIIFRATDLKDIRVLEPPKPQATLHGGLSSDPAIVKHSKAAPVGSTKLGYGAIGSQNSPEKRSSGSTQSGDVRRSPMDDSGLPNKNRSRHNSQSSGRGHVSGRGGPSPGQTIGFHRGVRGGSRGGGGNVTQGRSNQSFRGRGVGRGGFHQPGRPQPEKEALKFDGEYDFEQANVQFQEVLNKLSKTKLDDSAPVENGENGEEADDVVDDEGKLEDGEIEGNDEIFYDKQKSFFDSISCEALERSKGKLVRNDWRAEKRLNKETFGVAGNRRYGYGGGRGGYYNRGGRGYNQGGQGYVRGGYGRGGQRGFGGGYNEERGFGNGNGYGHGRGRGGYGGQGGYRVPRAFGGGYDDRDVGRGIMGGDRLGRGGYGRGSNQNQGICLRRSYWGGVRNQ